MSRLKKFNSILQEFSIPLISGVVVAMLWANLSPESYNHFMHISFIGDNLFFGHELNFHFLFNDFFMVLFFGIASVEITKAVSKGGPLFPISKAMNPVLSCLGGIVGPIGVFFLLTSLFPFSSILESGITLSEIKNGWAVPTATDIALAWFLAVVVFGKNHPAVSFLLILAVIDDAIGLAIIAIFYPTPGAVVMPGYLVLCVLGMFVSFLLRLRDIHSTVPYLVLGGGLSWSGLFFANLHPALALVFIVPFMPQRASRELHEKAPALDRFEHNFKYIVDIGLFGFGLANAGVLLASVNELTLVIFLSLFIGKTVGICLFAFGAVLAGFPLPKHMNFRTLFIVGKIAGLGLTVALFVAGVAYPNQSLQASAKMGALLSVAIVPMVLLFAKIFRIKKMN